MAGRESGGSGIKKSFGFGEKSAETPNRTVESTEVKRFTTGQAVNVYSKTRDQLENGWFLLVDTHSEATLDDILMVFKTANGDLSGKQTGRKSVARRDLMRWNP